MLENLVAALRAGPSDAALRQAAADVARQLSQLPGVQATAHDTTVIASGRPIRTANGLESPARVAKQLLAVRARSAAEQTAAELIGRLR